MTPWTAPEINQQEQGHVRHEIFVENPQFNAANQNQVQNAANQNQDEIQNEAEIEEINNPRAYSPVKQIFMKLKISEIT